MLIQSARALDEDDEEFKQKPNTVKVQPGQSPRDAIAKVSGEIGVKDPSDAVGTYGKAVGKAGQKFADAIIGDRNNAGILGQGQYKGSELGVDDAAFYDTSRFDQVNKDLASAIGGIRQQKMNTAAQNQGRSIQMDLARQLQQQAAGGGPPSIAQQMLANQTNQNIMNAQSQAASMRGVNPALALRMQQTQAANMNQQAGNQGAMLRSQEILNAQQGLAGLTQGMRGQDIGLAEAQQQGDLARNQLILGGIAQQGQVARDAVQGARDLAKLKVDQHVGMSGINQQAYADAAQRRSGTIQGIGSGIMSGLMGGLLSDRNLKTDIEPAGSDPAVQEFLDAISNSTYRYKNPAHGDGRYMGPMAQDLEKSEIGRDMVRDTPEGKMVDYGRGSAAYLGVAGMLNDRMDDLEKRIGSFLDKRGSKKK